MRSWLRKELGWFVLALTLLSLPGPASKACACARMSTDSGMSDANRGSKQACSRCASATTTATSTTASHRAQVSRRSCCTSKVTDAHAAETPSKLQIERHETRSSLPSAIAPPPATRGIRNRSIRAPAQGGTHDSAAPPASYLSDYLRL